MALANAACLLAAAGHRVLVIDWDLEAPGLHRYLHPFLDDPELAKTAGIIDLVWDYAAAASRKDSSDRDVFAPLSLADPAHVAIRTSYRAEKSGERGHLDFIGAGMQNNVYSDRARTFDWPAMFSRLDGAAFISRFGERCREAYDFTLIDSRTGIADTAGIATIVLPDRVVLCFTPNRQSVLGIRAVGESILAARPQLRLLPIATRVEKGVEGWREAQLFYRSQLDHLLPGDASESARVNYWGAAEIVHYPNYALGELLATFCDPPAEQNSLLSDMRRLVSRMVESDFMSSRETFAAPNFSESAQKRYSRRIQFRDPRIADLQEALDGDPSSGLISVLSIAADTSQEGESDLALLKQLGSTLHSLGSRLSSVGRLEEAVTARQTAVDLYRHQAQTRPDAFLPDLSSSLTNLGTDLSSLGRVEEALTANQQAVDIRRRLAQARPDNFLVDLATSLTNLSANLLRLGRGTEGMEAIREAVEIRRRLAQTQPDLFLADLARGLDNLEVVLRNLGRSEEALVAIQEGIEIRRGLAQTRPDAFLPELASKLTNLSVELAELGRREDALARCRETVDIYRRLVQTRPDAFLADLAASLSTFGTMLSDLDRREEASAVTQEAVEIRRHLARARRANVADIFISYSWRDRDLTRDLAAAIEARFGRGSVWWNEAGLRSGDRFSPEITRALDSAKAVVVVWTQSAVTSDWAYAEAARAANQRKVVMVRAADVEQNSIPLPFNVFHTCFVYDTPAVLDGIEKRLAGEASPLPPAVPGQGFRGYLLDSKQEALPRDAIARRPASLLLAKHRLVPFDDIHGLRDEFVFWATEVPPHAMGRTTLGRLVHAPAGLGKTRALIEIGDELTRAHGWLAGFVPRDIRAAGREPSEGALERLILGGRDAAGLMLIVDYAESRQDDVVWLADRLVRRAESVLKPARLVLLSRGSGVWWQQLVLKSQSMQQLFSLGGDAYDEVEIPEDIKLRDRRKLFETSVSAFSKYRSVASAKPAEAPSAELLRAIETENDYDRPLAVQIAALLHVAGVDTAEGRQGMAGLLDRILGLEYDHWDKTLKIAGQANWQAAVKNGVAQVTLVGHVDNAQAAEALIQRDPLFDDARDIDVSRVCNALSRIFPRENDGLAALEPALIGEHHVAHVVTDALVDACLDWAREDREQRQHILTVLNRATRAEHGGNASRAAAQLGRLVRTQAAVLGGDLVKVALETPGRLLDLCPTLEAQLDSLNDSTLAAIDVELPLQSLTLMELSLSVAARRADLARELDAAAAAATDVPPAMREEVLNHLAARVGTLGNRLSNVGRREEALAANQEAVDIYRRLAQTRPDTFLPDLATGMNNLGVLLSDLGRREEALAAAQEAVDIRRRLEQTRPDTFLPALATGLTNLGRSLSNLGRREEALAATQEAVDIRRRLVQSRTDIFLPALATSLTNLGIHLSDLGRREAALSASQEAVGIYRRLAQTRPDAFLPNLATSLNNSGAALSNLGRHDAALAAVQEAVDIRRRLAQTRPDAFLSALATSLTNLGGDLSNLGRHEDALATTQEAVDIYRRLAQTQPDAFLPNLAASLNNSGTMLSNLGRHEEALAATQDAVDINRRLAQTRPDAFLPNLAMNLNNLGIRFFSLGRRDDALAASQEAVDMYRRLAQTRPDAFLPDLARSTSVMSDALAAIGRHGDAAQAATQALEILAPFLERYPQTYQGLAGTIGADIVRYSEAAGQTPDTALLARAAKALGNNGTVEEKTD
jgi:tetratricopeptide (TPR) repeat protein